MSLVTNIIAIILILLSFVDIPYAMFLRSIGIFSFSGAVTNWLAIHMLFEKVPLLYGSGVIVNQFEEFKQAIKNLIMDQFFTKENLNQFLNFEQNNQSFDMTTLIDHDLFFKKMVEAVMESPLGGMLGMFGGPQALESMRPTFNLKIDEIAKELLSSDQLSEKLSAEQIAKKIELIVDQRLNELTPEMVKEIIQQMIKKHLGWLVVWGGFFGGVIGLWAEIVKTIN
jgi:uncharacterized membrane protein YheB (UPF0754 family)